MRTGFDPIKRAATYVERSITVASLAPTNRTKPQEQPFFIKNVNKSLKIKR